MVVVLVEGVTPEWVAEASFLVRDAAVAGALGPADPAEPGWVSSRAWRSGLPTTGAFLASNFRYGRIMHHKALKALGAEGFWRKAGIWTLQSLHSEGFQVPALRAMQETCLIHREWPRIGGPGQFFDLHGL